MHFPMVCTRTPAFTGSNLHPSSSQHVHPVPTNAKLHGPVAISSVPPGWRMPEASTMHASYRMIQRDAVDGHADVLRCDMPQGHDVVNPCYCHHIHQIRQERPSTCTLPTSSTYVGQAAATAVA